MFCLMLGLTKLGFNVPFHLTVYNPHKFAIAQFFTFYYVKKQNSYVYTHDISIYTNPVSDVYITLELHMYENTGKLITALVI